MTSMDTDEILTVEMEHITKKFPGVVALDDVDFSLKKGEVHVLLGENGAGKSTLIKILSGAYSPDSGSIRIYGKPARITNPSVARKWGISVIYQERSLAENLSVAENIYLGREPVINRRLGVVDWGALIRKSKAILDKLGIDIDPETPVARLSAAQQQMVEVAKAISADARIIVMDEPTSCLMSSEVEELLRTIRKLKAEGVSVIYISHRLEEVPRIGDRVTVLRDGRKIGTVPADTPVKDLIVMMVGRELKDKFPARDGDIVKDDVILKVEGLSRKGVLHDISFHVRRGEILGIAGLIGSGRTELARAIVGLDKIDSGKIYLRGKESTPRSPKEAIASGIGLIPEERRYQGLNLIMSVAQNITMASLRSFAKGGVINLKRERKAAAEHVSALQIKTPSLDQPVLYLSGGNQQKVVVSKCLCTRSEVLIFDEPTRGIDVGAKVEIYSIMNALVAGGAGIIMISSELPEILGMSDRILVMHRGRLVAEFSRDEASQEKILEWALLGTQAGITREATDSTTEEAQGGTTT